MLFLCAYTAFVTAITVRAFSICVLRRVIFLGAQQEIITNEKDQHCYRIALFPSKQLPETNCRIDCGANGANRLKASEMHGTC